MDTHEKVQTSDRPLSTGEIFDFFAGIAEQLPRDLLDPTRVRYYNAKKGRLGKDLRTLFSKPLPTFDIAEWERFFEKCFGRTFDLSNLHIPPKPDDSRRAIVVPPGLTNNEVFGACTKTFDGKTWRYESDLNPVVDVVKRHDGPYVVWIHDTVEADANMANKSANDINKADIDSMTLKERMLLELKYFDETGGHLDLRNWTLCAGSRYSGGGVPCCSWRGAEFGVYWANVGRRNPSLRVREAVS